MLKRILSLLAVISMTAFLFVACGGGGGGSDGGDPSGNGSNGGSGTSPAWKISTIASVSNDYLELPSIAVDSGGHAHVTYWDDSTLELIYATNISGTWVKSVLDTAADSDPSRSQGGSSIAIDSSGNLHVAYQHQVAPGEYRLNYTTKTSGVWTQIVFDGNTDIGAEISIGLDLSGNVHIAYYNRSSTDLMYATNASGSWAYETVDAGQIGYDISIVVDSAGYVHIAYFDFAKDAIMYATNKSAGWVMEQVDSYPYPWEGNPSIGLDSNDAVHISYTEGISSSRIMHATNASGTWVKTPVYDVYFAREESALMIGSSDDIHICGLFSDYVSEHNMMCGTNASGSWVFEQVGTFTESYHIDGAIDSTNKLHVVYDEVGFYPEITYATNR